MPYVHLSFCHTRKIIQHTVFLFHSVLYVHEIKLKKQKTKNKKKKTRIFHQRSQKIHLDLNLSLFLLFRLNTILVTNRWNRSHLSWIFSKFLTFTLHTFVLTQMCPSPSPMLSRAYFGALKWLQTQINIGERKIKQVFQKSCDEHCSWYQLHTSLPSRSTGSPSWLWEPWTTLSYLAN